MKKVLFLDFDGVMCLSTEWGGRFNKQKSWNKLNPDNQVLYTNDFDKMDVEYRFDNFNKKALKVLNQILLETDVEIVVSSDWRFSCTLDEMKDLFKKYGVLKEPIDYTPTLDIEDFDTLNKNSYFGEERSFEIKKWLALHPEVTHWVAVDDIDMNEKFKDGEVINGLSNFVHTKRESEGIKQSGIKEKIINFLK
jgi:hypothetical protein